MKKMLWISLNVPYDTVNHAGGKSHNFYIKYFQRSKEFEIHLISFMYSNRFLWFLGIETICRNISFLLSSEI